MSGAAGSSTDPPRSTLIPPEQPVEWMMVVSETLQKYRVDYNMAVNAERHRLSQPPPAPPVLTPPTAAQLSQPPPGAPPQKTQKKSGYGPVVKAPQQVPYLPQDELVSMRRRGAVAPSFAPHRWATMVYGRPVIVLP